MEGTRPSSSPGRRCGGGLVIVARWGGECLRNDARRIDAVNYGCGDERSFPVCAYDGYPCLG